ncbi:MAG TPA: hypothetical protein VMP11_02865 [Verrucomicrobiae bacterium]|nr:hypothetical protein [Verrucomicrobiae bacterium]
MDPLTASTAFGTVIQLVCNFRQEQAAREAAKLADFLSWLGYHKFEELKNVIQNSTNLQIEIQDLLKRDVEDVRAKLDLINESIVALASRIDGLSGIAGALGAKDVRLSDQAVAILQEFEKSRSTDLGVFLNIDPPQCALFPEGRGFTVRDGRFLADDIEILEGFGFIKFTHHNESGNPIYALTRAGAEYARAICAKG